MLLDVSLEYTLGEKTENYTGVLDTNGCIFTSEDKGKVITFDKHFERYTYNGRIIFINNDLENPEEWIFLILPSKDVLKKLNITNIDESSSEDESEYDCDDQEEENDTEEDEEDEDDSDYQVDDDEEDSDYDESD